MITFKQFFNQFLVEAKYHSMHKVHAPSHAPSYAIMHEGGRGNRGHYIVQDDMFSPQLQGAVGYIVTKPKNREFLDNDLRTKSIKAAMGVFSNDQKNDAGQKTTNSKMYAFHLAKNKLETPGARAGNNDDLAFYNSTIHETAELLRSHIASLNGRPYSIVQPFSTMGFNQAVIDRAIPNNNAAATTVDKMTFDEAKEIWETPEGRQESIIKYSANNERHRFIEGALEFLNHLLISEEDEALLQLIKYKPRQQLNSMQDKVSLERLAYIIMQISCTHALKRRGTELGYLDANYRWGADINEEEGDKEEGDDEEDKCNDRKAYYLSYLKPLYFKDLQGQLNNNIIVIDDNINSGTTYYAINNKIKQRNLQASITWVVGIIPIIKESAQTRAMMNAPAAQAPAAQAPAAQAPRQSKTEADKKIEELVKDIKNWHSDTSKQQLRISQVYRPDTIAAALKQVNKNNIERNGNLLTKRRGLF